jgi:drug/metabolite transporter (DMT)-like permease
MSLPGRAEALRSSIQRWRPDSPVARALLWSASAGVLFSLLNALMRALTLEIASMQAQFLRYLFGSLVLLPWVLKAGWQAWRPQRWQGHALRGAVHTVGLVLWFLALPRIPLADMTAIGFTGPIFILLGAALFLGEPMRWRRWVAVAAGFAGVLVIVGPKLSGSGGFWHLVMLASAPVFAASFLLTKALTRSEAAGAIVLWQAVTVTVLSLPLALPVWQAIAPWQWAAFVLCGVLGTSGHYCLTRSYVRADISATQSTRFLDLVWASLLGWAVFSDVPTAATLAGGAIIAAATLWLARRESRAIDTTDESP